MTSSVSYANTELAATFRLVRSLEMIESERFVLHPTNDTPTQPPRCVFPNPGVYGGGISTGDMRG